MEYARDLGQVELWEESLRRSLERRGSPRRSSVELHRLKPARDLTLADVVERSAHYSQLRRRASERPSLPRPSVALGGVSAMALLAAAAVPKLVGGGAPAHKPSAVLKETAAPLSPGAGTVAPSIPRPAMHPPRLMSPTATHPVAARHAAVKRPTPADAPAPQTTTSAPRATVASVASHSSGGAGLATAPRHTAAKTHAQTAHAKPSVPTRHSTSVSRATSTPVSSNSYVNPLAHASLTPERIDQGVDYSGSGTLTALGAGRVTYVGTSGTGWPGAFIEYRLTSGADSGRYVFYAEHVSPLVRVGQMLRPGQSVATIGGGIEIGWGSGVGTQPLAQAEGQWSHTSDAENYASPAGRSFSALIASLGGPPGKVEG